MEKIRLGISLYPEQESREDIERYLKTASEHGFTKVFTSLFSVEGTKEELVHYFRELTDLAHKYGMVVSGDCNG
ncbi:MupG family TIM beta-alpha barrel fold protein, partial [Faecalibaculum rodentium]